jgi:hypothetical protein
VVEIPDGVSGRRGEVATAGRHRLLIWRRLAPALALSVLSIAVYAQNAWASPAGGASPGAAGSERVPYTLGALILVFVVAQWLVDRRDPKFVDAPARKDDDSVGFE